MRLTLLTVTLVVASACATATGPDAANRFDHFKAVQTTDFRSFERVQVLMPVAAPEITERIDARGGLYRRERPLSQRDVAAQLEGLHSDLVRALSREAQIVQNGGEGVLTVKTTLTHLNANRPTQAELSANPGLSIQSIATGDAGVTIELSEDGRLLATIKDRDNIQSLNDPAAQAVGVWSTANRFYAQVSDKVASLLRE